MQLLSILNDFDEYPGLRNCSISEKSGEEFYHSILNTAFYKAFEKQEKLVVDLDGTGGYASSFLDEAFGNLVYDFSLAVVKESLVIKSEQEPHWIEMIYNKTFLEWEHRRKNKDVPIVTKNHNPWYKLEDGILTQDVWEKPVS